MAKKSYVIAGPTASGKSGFAHRLAKRIGGTIINSDSVQIYRGIENISASPFANREITPEIDGVPYRLYSIRDLFEQINVAEWLELARAEYELAELPIFVGGSGMYVSALTSGLSPIPEISAENRRRAREMVEKTPAAAKALTDFEFKDPNRTARALEVFLETGRPISEWQALPRRGAITPAPIRILISPPKDLLDERIAARVREMLDTGGLEEARTHMDYPDRAIGIEEIGRHLRGEISLQWALENLAARTSQYAKRQRTWFRSQFDENILFPHVPMDADLEKLLTIK